MNKFLSELTFKTKNTTLKITYSTYKTIPSALKKQDCVKLLTKIHIEKKHCITNITIYTRFHKCLKIPIIYFQHKIFVSSHL